MLDVYREIRRSLTLLMEGALGIPAGICHIQCPGARSPASSAVALKTRQDAAVLRERLLRYDEAQPARLFGVVLLREIRAEHGHLNFFFTAEAYRAMLGETLRCLPAPPALSPPGDRVEYAAWRMAMLARKGDSPLPEDSEVILAFYLALGIAEQGIDAKRLRLRQKEAAEALLSMGHHLPPRERPALFDRCGSVARCALALLSLHGSEE